jgi:hypothetical protein
MSNAPTFAVDFVVKKSPAHWKMVLVEEGPWPGLVVYQLRRLQSRMDECLDAILDGKLAEQFPESKGAHISVELECFNVPRAEVESFVDRFAAQVPLLDDYQKAMQDSPYASGVSFKAHFKSVY